MKIDFTKDTPIEHRLERIKNFTDDKFEVAVENSSGDDISVSSSVPYISKAEAYTDGDQFLNTLTFDFQPTSKALGIKISSMSGRSIDILITR